MENVVGVQIHSSQFPRQVARDLAESLRSRRINHKFHYDSPRQTLQWLRLHEACSPARTDPACLAIYDRASATIARRIPGQTVQVIGLGCGGGQKDTALLQQLRAAGKQVAYLASDVSLAMVLTARETARTALPGLPCGTLVCDLATAEDLREGLAGQSVAGATRLITFFGMLPNFESSTILPRLASLVRPGDGLLVSANLAPGPDYAKGIQQILPLYDNALTRDWLLGFLLNLGLDPGDGAMAWHVEPDPTSPALHRVAAYYKFGRARDLEVDGAPYSFAAGEELRLFFSNRHTPGLLRELLAAGSLQVVDQWITPSGEEGVFSVAPSGA